jgi:hypothetical protein
MVGEGEMSPRALKLTGDIIAMNPAHYTIWYPLSSRVFVDLGHIVHGYYLL